MDPNGCYASTNAYYMGCTIRYQEEYPFAPPCGAYSDPASPTFWDQSSPVWHYDEVGVPAFIVNGEDERVRIVEPDDLALRLINVGVTHDRCTVPDEVSPGEEDLSGPHAEALPFKDCPGGRKVWVETGLFFLANRKPAP